MAAKPQQASPPPAGGSRRDETRARLFTAAVRLFAQHGYADTTVERIVREAGVAKGTFFLHFATKDAVVTELVRTQVEVARRARARVLASGGSPVDALRAAAMTLGEQAAADRELTRAVITANILSPLLGGFAESVFGGIIDEMTDDVRAAQRARLLDPRADGEAIAGMLVTSYFGAALYFATAPRSKPLMQLLAPVVEANLAGFRVADPSVTPPARKATRPSASKAARPARSQKRAPPAALAEERQRGVRIRGAARRRTTCQAGAADPQRIRGAARRRAPCQVGAADPQRIRGAARRRATCQGRRGRRPAANSRGRQAPNKARAGAGADPQRIRGAARPRTTCQAGAVAGKQPNSRDGGPSVSLIVRGTERTGDMAKGIEKGKKDNKPKLSIKEKQKKKKEKQASK